MIAGTRMTRITTWPGWWRLLLGLVLVFGLFHWSAGALGSDLGQHGVLVGALVVAATFAVERALFRTPVRAAARSLGLGRPHPAGMIAAACVVLLLFLVVALFARASGSAVGFLPGWTSLLAGLFAQAGIAEEILFRGYLFGRLRAGRSFWRAAAVSMLPFVAVHLILFFTMPWPIALAAVLLSMILSFPLAHLFELGGSTIWAPALVHFVIQGTVKVIVLPDGGAGSFPIVWMAASAVVSMFTFVARRRPG